MNDTPDAGGTSGDTVDDNPGDNFGDKFGDNAPTRLRLAVCWATVATMLPYLGLKIAWLSGRLIGIKDRQLAANPALAPLNALTLGMDGVALLTVLALTYRWGLRLPAWPVVFPMWTACGLVGTIAISAPLGFLATAIGGGGLTAPGTPEMLHSWVYLAVYTGFSGQGVGLTVAFVLYVRARWPKLFRIRVADLRRGASASVRTVLANGVSLLALLTALPALYWAGGGTAGLSREDAAGTTDSGRVMEGVLGLLALGTVVGVVTLVRRRSTGRALLPLAAVWLGSGSMFAWGMWGEIVMVCRPFADSGRETAVQALELYFQSLAGILLALVTLFLVVESVPAHPAALQPDAARGREFGRIDA